MGNNLECICETKAKKCLNRFYDECKYCSLSLCSTCIHTDEHACSKIPISNQEHDTEEETEQIEKVLKKSQCHSDIDDDDQVYKF